MSERSEQERLLIHDTVAITVDTIVAAIQQELDRAGEALNDEVRDRTRTRIEHARIEGFVDGLRAATGSAAIASVAARAASLHVERAVA